MKKTYSIILGLSLCLVLAGLTQNVSAVNTSVYVTPGTQTIASGNTLSASVFAGAPNEKVCVVTGTVVFNNLTCKSITVASGAVAQATPTCASPTFVVGIPKCTMADLKVLNITATAGEPGKASISFTGVNIIGATTSPDTASFGATYTVVPAPTPAPTATETTPEITATETVNTEVTPEITETVPPQPAAVGSATGFAGLMGWFKANWLWVIIILLVLAGAYWWYYRKNNTSPTN